MRLSSLALLMAMTMASIGAAAGLDGAVIVDSGSTNTSGYKIVIRSDGNATVQLQNRIGVTHGEPKSFTVSAAVVARFFGDLKKAKTANLAGSPCMKSASFGTTTHVTYHGWQSPDLDCAPEGALTTALVADLDAIRHAAGVDSMVLPRGGPLRVAPTPPAS